MNEHSRKIMMNLRGHSGMVLMASVMLIVFASIIILSSATFVVSRLKQSESQRISADTIYLAQAGIQQALYNFRFRDLTGNGYFSKGQTNLDANRFFVLGGTPADLLLVNTATAALTSGQSEIANLTIQNATNSNTITIDRIIVSWNNVRTLRRIRINGANVWNGNQASPVNADLSPNVTLNVTPSIYAINYFRFSGNMVGATVTAQFLMSDGSSKTVTIYPASNNNNFNVIAMGKTATSSIYRTIQITYNTLTGRVINSKEMNVTLP